LRARPGVNGIQALRAALKVLLRRFGLRCESVEEEIPNANDEAGSR
jgi:hypothetical protein